MGLRGGGNKNMACAMQSGTWDGPGHSFSGSLAFTWSSRHIRGDAAWPCGSNITTARDTDARAWVFRIASASWLPARLQCPESSHVDPLPCRCSDGIHKVTPAGRRSVSCSLYPFCQCPLSKPTRGEPVTFLSVSGDRLYFFSSACLNFGQQLVVFMQLERDCKRN